MSADVLRQAAKLMRERAEAASAGPWKRFGMAGVAGAEWEVVDERRVTCDGCDEPVALLGCVTNADALHIASWHPAVALAVADWLGVFSEHWVDDPGCDLGGGMDGPPCGDCYKCCHYENQIHALAVARAYLGDDA